MTFFIYFQSGLSFIHTINHNLFKSIANYQSCYSTAIPMETTFQGHYATCLTSDSVTWTRNLQTMRPSNHEPPRLCGQNRTGQWLFASVLQQTLLPTKNTCKQNETCIYLDSVAW